MWLSPSFQASGPPHVRACSITEVIKSWLAWTSSRRSKVPSASSKAFQRKPTDLTLPAEICTPGFGGQTGDRASGQGLGPFVLICAGDQLKSVRWHIMASL